MATTNFLQWNNSAINQETDSQYLADSLRVGGAPTDALLPSPTFNKFAYQASTFYTAFCMMLAGKGYSTSDEDINVLAAVLANVVTDADLSNALVTIGYSPTPSIPLAGASAVYMPLNGNAQVQGAGGFNSSTLYALIFRQDGTGGRVVTYAGGSGFLGFGTPDPTPNTTSIQLFRFVPTNSQMVPCGPMISANGNVNIAAGVTAAQLVIANGGTFGGAIQAASAVIGGLVQAATMNVAGVLSAGTINVTQLNANAAQINTTLNVSGNTTMGGSLVVASAANVGALQIGGGAPNGAVLTGNGSTYVGTTPAGSQGGNGWTTLPGGIIIMWGTGAAQATGNDVQQTINFPRAGGFPNNVFAVVVGNSSGAPSDGKPQTYVVVSQSRTQFLLQQLRGDDQGNITTAPIWFAIGN